MLTRIASLRRQAYCATNKISFQRRVLVRALDVQQRMKGLSMAPRLNVNQTIAHNESSWTGWRMLSVFCASVVVGLLVAIAFAAISLVIVDILEPIAGTIRFATILNDLWPHISGRQFFDVLDKCGLGPAWLDRVKLVAAVSSLVFCFAANQTRKAIAGHGLPSAQQQRVTLTFALVMVIAATAVCALLRPPTNPHETIACVSDLEFRSEFGSLRFEMEQS